MKIKQSKIALSLMTVMLMLGAIVTTPVMADCGGAKTSVLNCEEGQNGIYWVLNLVLEIMSFGVVVLAVVGLVVAGIQYITAKDSADQVKKAKDRIFQIVVGLVIYALMWSLLEWLIPGGIIN